MFKTGLTDIENYTGLNKEFESSYKGIRSVKYFKIKFQTTTD